MIAWWQELDPKVQGLMIAFAWIAGLIVLVLS